MSVKHKEYFFPSSTGVCQIYARSWCPDNPKAVVQIHHGMAEHIERYDEFAQYLAQRGFVVYAHDMANHGKSNQNPDERGYFGEKDAWKNLIKDMKNLYDIAKKEHPDLPYFVFGHSMGSFITRCFIAKYKDAVDGAIICGTGGKQGAAPAGLALTNIIGAFKGKKSKSAFVQNMAFGTYNKPFGNRTEFEWLTRDEKIVDKYVADEMCGFLFSVQGFNDLLKLIVSANADSWYDSVPKDLPICLISGDKDPVGNFGKGVEEVYKKLKETDHNVYMKLYGNDRHEILNERNKEDVYIDVVNFIENVMDGKVVKE